MPGGVTFPGCWVSKEDRAEGGMEEGTEDAPGGPMAVLEIVQQAALNRNC